jgi:hypothetical protein
MDVLEIQMDQQRAAVPERAGRRELSLEQARKLGR